MKECHQNLTENAEAEEKHKRRKHPKVASLQNFTSLRMIDEWSLDHTASPNMA